MLWNGTVYGRDRWPSILPRGKAFVDLDKIGQIRIKLRKTLEYLNKTPETVIVYVSGKYWSTSRDPMGMARDLGFGILQENGRDLEVKDPVRGSGLGHCNGGQVEKAMEQD
ncbi:hypothetical protein BS47DRAFT_1347896 [Hydnum rufescens UP504]|uniref:Uncharacterized protein n=1 Tax=Hydnum rufescens UP504 TaxID=1448309 RepID=A0A9P6AS81_9AGAM|nr:hypothetical protein BS47DRAFT_1347896 [Hydnum rufescens UP504]